MRCTLSGWSLCHVAVQFMYSLHTIMMTDFILGSQALEDAERDTTTRHYNTTLHRYATHATPQGDTMRATPCLRLSSEHASGMTYG